MLVLQKGEIKTILVVTVEIVANKRAKLTNSVNKVRISMPIELTFCSTSWIRLLPINNCCFVLA